MCLLLAWWSVRVLFSARLGEVHVLKSEPGVSTAHGPSWGDFVSSVAPWSGGFSPTVWARVLGGARKVLGWQARPPLAVVCGSSMAVVIAQPGILNRNYHQSRDSRPHGQLAPTCECEGFGRFRAWQ